MHDSDNPKCFASHMIEWAIKPDVLTRLVAAAQSDMLPMRAAATEPQAAHGVGNDKPAKIFSMTTTGIAVLSLEGVMMRGESKWDDTVSTQALRQQIRAAANDEDVRAIMLHADTPGGTVAGTFELAEDIRAADAVKPVFAHGDDMVASAGIWAVSQARTFTANTMAQIGSIGTYAVLEDTSGMAERDGVKVHVISTGEFKGAGVAGTELSDEFIAHVQSQIDAMNTHFLAAVQSGRNLSDAQLKAASDGRTFMAAEAQGMGLIDGVMSFDEAMAQAESAIDRPRARTAAARISIARQG
jgi:signal peptide peptidase SppA